MPFRSLLSSLLLRCDVEKERGSREKGNRWLHCKHTVDERDPKTLDRIESQEREEIDGERMGGKAWVNALIEFSK